MPDLNIEHYWVCEDLDYFQMRFGSSTLKGESYNVTCVRGEWDCTCTGFRFRKTCKHIEAAKKKRCTWSQYIHGGDAVTDKHGERRCPKCGGPVTAVPVAV